MIHVGYVMHPKKQYTRLLVDAQNMQIQYN